MNDYPAMRRMLHLFWVFLVLLAPVSFAQAAISGIVNVFPDSGASLEQVLENAVSGATIQVHPGIFHVHLVLKRPVRLIGMKGAVLDGSHRGNVVQIQASNVSISGFVIRNSGINLTNMDAGIFIDQHAANTVIRDNWIIHDLFGIWLNGDSSPKIVNNHIKGIRKLRSQDRGDGIHLWNVDGGLIKGNNVWQTRDGIYIYVSKNIVLENNYVHEVRYGFHWMYSNYCTLLFNRTTGDRAGYALMFSQNLLVASNSSINDRNYGLLLNFVNHSQISGNTVVHVKAGLGYGTGGSPIPGSAGMGMFIYDSNYDQVSYNWIADNEIGVNFTGGSQNGVVFGNAFLYNRIEAKYVQNMSAEWSLNGRGNYWSGYMGWDLNGDGIGDTPYRPNSAVDVLLWKYPMAHLLLGSPSMLVLRWAQKQFPVTRPPSVQDSYPLMHTPLPIPQKLKKLILHYRRN